MKSIYYPLTAVVLMVASATHHAKADEWVGRDKNLHFAAGALIGASSSVYFEYNNYDHPVLDAIASGMVVGGLKEGYDSLGHGDPSLKDFAVTVLGSAMGASIGHGFYMIAVTENHETDVTAGFTFKF